MDYVTLFLRTSLMYLIALLVFRLMKRSVANMAPLIGRDDYDWRRGGIRIKTLTRMCGT